MERSSENKNFAFPLEELKGWGRTYQKMKYILHVVEKEPYPRDLKKELRSKLHELIIERGIREYIKAAREAGISPAVIAAAFLKGRIEGERVTKQT